MVSPIAGMRAGAKRQIGDEHAEDRDAASRVSHGLIPPHAASGGMTPFLKTKQP